MGVPDDSATPLYRDVSPHLGTRADGRLLALVATHLASTRQCIAGLERAASSAFASPASWSGSACRTAAAASAAPETETSPGAEDVVVTLSLEVLRYTEAIFDELLRYSEGRRSAAKNAEEEEYVEEVAHRGAEAVAQALRWEEAQDKDVTNARANSPTLVVRNTFIEVLDENEGLPQVSRRHSWDGCVCPHAGNSASSHNVVMVAPLKRGSAPAICTPGTFMVDSSSSVTASKGKTVMLRNVPPSYTREELLEFLATAGFAGRYTFVYLPVAFKKGCSLGYALVCFIQDEDAEAFLAHLQLLTPPPLQSVPPLEGYLEGMDRTLEDLIARYRNSPVMHPSVPERYKPLLFEPDGTGARTPFPPPTAALRAPRVRKGGQKGATV